MGEGGGWCGIRPRIEVRESLVRQQTGPSLSPDFKPCFGYSSKKTIDPEKTEAALTAGNRKSPFAL
jgi:hypothetical protein